MRNQEKRQYSKRTLYEFQELLYSDLTEQNIKIVCQGIESLNKKSETQLLQLGYDSIKATQYVGMVQVGDFIIEVLPKIDYRSEFNNQENKKFTAGRNLLVMLSYAYNINFDSNTLSSLTEQTGNWYDLLIRYFAVELHKQIRIGLSKNYKPKEESLPFIRGQWDISRQMRKHAYSMLEFDLNFDEFTENVLINQVFKTIVQLLIFQTTDKESKRLLLDINQMLSNVNALIRIDDSTFERVHFTRLNSRFKYAFQLARLFFLGKSLQVRAGNMTAFAFLFDMNQLFEKFLVNFLIRHKSSIFRNFRRTPLIRSQTASETIYLAKEFVSEKRMFQLRPDIVLIDPTTKGNWLIIDTKYKQLDQKKKYSKIERSDIYQMLAYSIRLNSDKVILLYPEPETNLHLQKHMIIPHNSSETQIFIRTVDLHQPLDRPINLINDIISILQPIIGGY